MTALNTIKSNLPMFGQEIEKYLTELGIVNRVRELDADHVGLRFKNAEDVSSLKTELSTEGKLISSAVVNGREIYIFELHEPLRMMSWSVPCIELPFPKATHPYEDGLEHVEFVIPSSAKTLEEMRAAFQTLFPNVDIKSLKESGQYSESLPVSETEQLPNPSIELRKRIGLTIKFHPNSIKDVVGSV